MMIEKKNWFIDFYCLDFGVWLYVCHQKELNVPIGFLWGQAFGPMFYIYGIFTPEWTRRKGIATYLCNHLLKSFKTILTGTGSSEGGLEFIKYFGFRENKKLGWVFVPSKKIVK